MNKVLAIVGAALLLSTSVAQAVEVHANPGTKVIVFGLAKSGDNCVKANGNTICPPVQIATIVIANGGMIEVPVTAKQIRDSKKDLRQGLWQHRRSSLCRHQQDEDRAGLIFLNPSFHQRVCPFAGAPFSFIFW
jgi:hypothetical protein